MIRERQHQWCSAEALGTVMRTTPGTATAEDGAVPAMVCPDCGEPVVIVPTRGLVGLRRPELFGETVVLNAEGPAEFFLLHGCARPTPQGTGGVGLRARRPERQSALSEGVTV